MRAAGLALGLALLCGTPLPGQRPHRAGLWGELSSGVGHARIACSGCTGVIGSSGATSVVRIGGTVSDHVVIGVEVFTFLDRAFGFAPGDSTTTAETGTIAVVLLWFPGRHGLFLKGGVGGAFGQFSLPTGPAQVDTSTGGGMGLTFGGGWDWSISRKLAITLNGGVFVTALGDVALPSRRVDDVIATMYQVSVGLTFR